jgi:hypothetical protein
MVPDGRAAHTGLAMASHQRRAPNDIAFESKQQCEVDKQRVILHAKNASAENDTSTLQLYYWMMLQCVSSDDPRLKGN